MAVDVLARKAIALYLDSRGCLCLDQESALNGVFLNKCFSATAIKEIVKRSACTVVLVKPETINILQEVLWQCYVCLFANLVEVAKPRRRIVDREMIRPVLAQKRTGFGFVIYPL